MSVIEIAYLVLVLASFSAFGVTLALVSWACRDRSAKPARVDTARLSPASVRDLRPAR